MSVFAHMITLALITSPVNVLKALQFWLYHIFPAEFSPHQHTSFCRNAKPHVHNPKRLIIYCTNIHRCIIIHSQHLMRGGTHEMLGHWEQRRHAEPWEQLFTRLPTDKQRSDFRKTHDNLPTHSIISRKIQECIHFLFTHCKTTGRKFTWRCSVTIVCCGYTWKNHQWVILFTVNKTRGRKWTFVYKLLNNMTSNCRQLS